jgi:hypothetical protein
LALGVVLACLAGRAYAQDGKAQTVGPDGLTIKGTVEGTDDRVTVVRGENKLRIPAKRYQVKMSGGTKYRLEMVSDDFDSFLVVQDADGKQLAFDDDSGGNLNAKLDFAPPADGTYRVFAASFRGTGKFTLTVSAPGGGGKKPADGKVHTVPKGGLKLEGKVAATDKRVNVRPPNIDKDFPMPAKMYQVKMDAGVKYQLLMSSDDFDSFLVIQDAAGKQLAFDDDSGGGTNGLDAKLDFTPPAAGTYKVFAASLKGTGKFTLTVRREGEGKEKAETKTGKEAGKQEGVPKGKVHTVGQDGLTITADLSEADKRVEVAVGDNRARLPSKMYLVELMAGAKYRLEMVSKTLDSFLIVQDQDGKQLAFDDDSGGGANKLDARLDFTPPKTGTYKIFTASNAKDTRAGKFTLTIRRQGGAKEEGQVQEIGKDGLNINGTLDADNKSRVYQVKLLEGKTYVIDMTSPDSKALDPFLRLQNASGKQLALDDDSGGNYNARLIFRAPATGTYRIVATSFANLGQGEFTLKVREK